jgi:hypothetical protein
MQPPPPSPCIKRIERHSSFAATAITVRVSMFQLLRGRLSHVRDLDIEYEIDAGERMVRVEQHIVAFDCGDRDDRCMLITAGLKLITNVQVAFHRQLCTLDALNLFRIAFSVSLSRRDLHSSFFTELSIAQLLVEPGNNLAGAFKVRDRIATRRGIKHPVRGIA